MLFPACIESEHDCRPDGNSAEKNVHRAVERTVDNLWQHIHHVSVDDVIQLSFERVGHRLHHAFLRLPA